MENISKDLKNKDKSQLQKSLIEFRDKLRDLRFKVASKQHKDVREIRVVRKTIAKIMTFLNKKD